MLTGLLLFRKLFTSVTMLRTVLLCLFLAVEAATASDVLEFTDDNFKERIDDYDTLLVEFYAPWCGHCKKLAPEYEKAATKLQEKYKTYEKPPVRLAKVDCIEEKETCSEFGVSGYPTLKIFKNGEFSKDYDGGRDAASITNKMSKEAGPSTKVLTTLKELEEFTSGEGVAVVGFFQDEDGSDAKTLKKVADTADDIRVGLVSDSVIQEKTKHKEEIVLYRPKPMENKFEDREVKHTDSMSTSAIKKFVQKEGMGLCGLRTAENADKFDKPVFIAFYDVDYTRNPKGTNYWRNRVMKVAKKLKDEGIKANFAVSNKMEMARELEECGQSDDSKDTPVVCAYDQKSRKFNMKEDFSMDNFEKFVRDVLDDKLEPFMKSEPLPDNDKEAVKIAVAKNFEELVNDKEKDVLIEFYAPWCGHCKNLAPKYEELAEKLKNEPEIVIAKMDATANDVPSPYDVKGFPTLYFVPKGKKSNPVKYDGGRDVKDFVKYLAVHATNELQGYDRNGKKKGGKKKVEL